MRRSLVAVIAVASFVLVVGCSQSSDSESRSSTVSSVTSLDANGVLDRFVAALRPLAQLGSSNADPEETFREMSRELTPLIEPLTNGIDGIPSDVTTEVAVATGTFVVGVDLVTECLSAGDTSESCAVFESNALSQSGALGSAMAKLVPYSDWTLDELVAAINGS